MRPLQRQANRRPQPAKSRQHHLRRPQQQPRPTQSQLKVRKPTIASSPVLVNRQRLKPSNRLQTTPLNQRQRLKRRPPRHLSIVRVRIKAATSVSPKKFQLRPKLARKRQTQRLLKALLTALPQPLQAKSHPAASQSKTAQKKVMSLRVLKTQTLKTEALKKKALKRVALNLRVLMIALTVVLTIALKRAVTN